ncbi:hypothetical protein DBZ36_10135 [Alginatibacterium sediminis]|uniref:GTP-binding protein n=1 Tax=Alginatibacterium sediminis TaxID=2164068 RepID=A0A420EDK4_9ALTE|nr:hypothetical protein [Alginatibacterium sediminis]RKF18746.1 hypothetical protein DBZ36_10135 [Alginatibacterium sediminis]
MLAIFEKVLLIGLLSLVFPLSAAQDAIENSTETNKPQINLQLNLEVVGIDKAAQQAAQALTNIATSMEMLANDPELSVEEQAQLDKTFLAIEQLSTQLNASLQQVPKTLEQSAKPIVSLADNLSQKIQLWVIIILVALVLIIIASILAIYFGVLAPTSRSIITVTSHVNQLASSLKITAELVEKTTQQNQVLLERLDEDKT